MEPFVCDRQVENRAEDLLEKFRPRSTADESEIGLIRRATPLVDAFGGRLPLSRELADIREHFGREIAQTVFTQSLERSKIYGAMIRRVRSFDPRTYSSIRDRASSFEVTIVRSTLPIRGIEWGAFAETWQTWARSMGFTTDIIDTHEENDLRANARIISTYLFSNPHPRRILVTYGQGASEFRSLLATRMGLRGLETDSRPGRGSDLRADLSSGRSSELSSDGNELSSIHTWINVAGAVGGAAFARLENDSRWRSMLVKLTGFFGHFSIQDRARRLRELDSRLPAWRALPNYPPQLRVINLVGLPTMNVTPLNLLVAHEQLSREIGLNDGAIGLYEAIAHPGLIVPIPGMTHNVESVKLEPILKRVLAMIAADAEISVEAASNAGSNAGSNAVQNVDSEASTVANAPAVSLREPGDRPGGGDLALELEF
jgi:hypothetical protein